MAAEVMRRRAEFVAQYRWGIAFGIAIAITFMTLPMRPRDAPLAYDLLPALALGAVWLAAGLILGKLGRRWARLASACDLPIARVER